MEGPNCFRLRQDFAFKYIAKKWIEPVDDKMGERGYITISLLRTRSLKDSLQFPHVDLRNWSCFEERSRV